MIVLGTQLNVRKSGHDISEVWSENVLLDILWYSVGDGVGQSDVDIVNM